MIAKELERTLRDTQGYKPIMIRSTDEFVNLDDRYQKARELGADLFVKRIGTSAKDNSTETKINGS